MEVKKIASLKTVEQFRSVLQELGVELPVDETIRVGQETILGEVKNSRCGKGEFVFQHVWYGQVNSKEDLYILEIQ